MDLFIGSSLFAFFIYVLSNFKQTDLDKIKHTFNNLIFRADGKFPKHFKTHKANNRVIYSFHTPYGLVDDKRLDVLEKVLNKPAKVTFANGKLHVTVYDKKIPTKVDYYWTKTDGWTVPVGKSHEGLIYHDFDKIPHMTIAGMTRQGKTVMLKLIFAHLINSHPDDVEFYIIDLKGGLEFEKYRNLRQVKDVASSVNESFDILQSIQREIKADMRAFKVKGYSNIVESPINRRRFIIVDEGAELTPSRHHTKDEKAKFNYCQHVLAEIARVAGALGYRLIFATQYPTADTLPRQIKQNSDAKISFRLPTEIASRVAIDEQGAEKINTVGRAIYRTVDKAVVQTLYIDDNDIKERLSNYVVSTAKKEQETRKNIVKFG